MLCSHQLSPRDAGSVTAPSGMRSKGDRQHSLPHLVCPPLISHGRYLLFPLVSEKSLQQCLCTMHTFPSTPHFPIELCTCVCLLAFCWPLVLSEELPEDQATSALFTNASIQMV